jgi:hypothetical protein
VAAFPGVAIADLAGVLGVSKAAIYYHIERDGSVGFGRSGKPDVFIHANRPLSGPTHVAMASPDRATAHAFHAASPAPRQNP